MNFPDQEKKILKFWNKNKIFERSIQQRAKAGDFVFYEGPPTANAKPGIHHVLSRVYKDVICRYKTMQGFRVLRKAGWDTHGLPVELEIEKKHGFKNKKDIENYGIAKFNKECRRSVWQYKKNWEKLTERIGFWLDMENPYITYDSSYMETLWWIIKQIWQKGLLYKDYKVVPHCPRCGTSLSSHEVALGYKKIKEPAIYVKFRVQSSESRVRAGLPTLNPQLSTYLLVWTTTPWTLPGNVAVAVNPKLTYAAVKKDGEILILVKERLGALGEAHELLAEIKGRDLLGIEYEPLYKLPGFKLRTSCFKTIAGDFVSAEEGTGLVHIAPAFGEDDMRVSKENNLSILMTVDESGKFKPEVEKWAGMFVKDADRLIIEDLKKRGLLFKEEKYEHDYPFCWRCSSPLLYYAKESWFIRMTAVKNKLLENNKKINWFPAHLKEGRFGEWLKETKDWAFSRERYWGTPLPVWQCQTGNFQLPTFNFQTNSKFKISNFKRCDNMVVIGSVKDLISQKSSRNRYYLARHGHSLRQVKSIAMCWPEKKRFGLTAQGRQQARKMAKELSPKNIDLIFSSDLLRTKQTAEIIAKQTGAKVIFDKRLREYDVGIFNGKDPQFSWDYLRKYKDKYSIRLPGGESLRDLSRRMYDFLSSINKKYRDKSIVIISHELPITLLGGALKGWSVEKIVEWRRLGKIDRIGTGEWREVRFVDLPYNERMEIDLHRPYVDKVVFACQKCGGIMARVPEVVDVWFDSGAMPFASAFTKATADKQGRIKPPRPFPADYICEAVDQTRGWFYTLLAVSTLLGFGPPYKNVISLGHVLDEKGEKMSKSKGNVVDPWLMLNKYGADAVRWYFFTVNQPGDAKLFAEKDIDLALKKFILTFWNSYAFWKTYNKNSKVKTQTKLQVKSQNLLDKWVLSRLNGLLNEVTSRLNDYDITGAARAIEAFVIDDLSSWYIRRSRRRFQHPGSEQELEVAAGTLRFILVELSKLAAPFIPFVAELIYRDLGGDKKSVHLEDWPKIDKKLIDKKLEQKMALVRDIVNKVLAERARAGIRVRQPLSELRINNKELRNKKELLGLIKEEVNVKRIIIAKEFSLDTKITPELKEEGLLRELVRYIQELRKQGNLKPQHRITIFYAGEPDAIKIIERHRDRILAETRADGLVLAEPAQKTRIYRQVSLEEGVLHLGIKRVGRKKA